MTRLLLMLAVVLASQSLYATTTPNRPVATLDTQRYLGQWHEIAHLPLFFQRKCVGPVTTTYAMAPDAKLAIQATCATRKGNKTVDGVGRFEPGQPAAFKVRFAPAWLSWLPQAWFDYWVIDIDPDYQWAIIGGPGATHLWILARNRTMNRALYQRLVARARDRGYPVEKLVIMSPLD